MSWLILDGVPHYDGVPATTHPGLGSDIDQIWIAEAHGVEHRYVERFDTSPSEAEPLQLADVSVTRRRPVLAGAAAGFGAALLVEAVARLVG